MKIGIIWQIIIGEFDGFKNLKVGHETGLDIISNEKKIIIELKNRYNTDNKSARISNFEKLIKFKERNKEFLIIYGVINCNSKEGKDKIIK